MKAILLATGLLMAGQLYAASTTGTIGVKLTIVSQCQIDGRSGQRTPQIACGMQPSAQPRVTQSRLPVDAQRKTAGKLITIEW
ncbi:hypothetical protein [Duffyella gerundensis]|uniref:hypothetical protein n=1 Tax=Duffyella gerundensis TaxID=1619313 RepID=UPI00082F35E0|nr:hypothetical protein [Duffyella gerundensis]